LIHVTNSCMPCLNIHYKYLFNFQETFSKVHALESYIEGLSLKKIACKQLDRNTSPEARGAKQCTRHCSTRSGELQLAVASFHSQWRARRRVNPPVRPFCSQLRATCSQLRVLTVQHLQNGDFDPKTSIQIPKSMAGCSRSYRTSKNSVNTSIH
jgi:hypothetical protein